MVSKIHYYLKFQEYSNTSENRFVSVYNISGQDEKKAREAYILSNIQYSYGGSGIIHAIKNCNFFFRIKNIQRTKIIS